PTRFPYTTLFRSGVQQHAGQTVTSFRGVQIASVGRAARELIKPHRRPPTVIETVNVVEHEPGAEGVRPANFLKVSTDFVRSNRTEGDRKLAGPAKARIQADLRDDRNAVPHRLKRRRVRSC